MAHSEHTSSAGEQPTCGQGLAQHAAVPAKIADFLESLAENLTSSCSRNS
jgi:hypothetical protein